MTILIIALYCLGCFMLIYDRHDKQTVYIDGRETSPRYLTESDYNNMTKYQGGCLKVRMTNLNICIVCLLK